MILCKKTSGFFPQFLTNENTHNRQRYTIEINIIEKIKQFFNDTSSIFTWRT